MREVDAASLETKGEVDLGQAPGRGVVIGERLVVPLDDGTVAVVDGDEVAAEVDAGGDDDFLYVTQLGDRATILNTSRSALRVLDPASGEATDARDVDLPEGELVVPRTLPGGPLWLLAARSGELVGLDPATGKGPRGPVVAAGHVGRPSPPPSTTGSTWSTRRPARSWPSTPPPAAWSGREALGLPDASRVELIARGGKAFVNDRAGNLAVVIDGDEYRRVDKYTDEGVATADAAHRPARPGAGPAAEHRPLAGARAPARPDARARSRAGRPAGVGRARAPAGRASGAARRLWRRRPGNESATVRWAAGAGGAATSYRIAYDGLGTPMEVGGGELSGEVTGLTNGELLHVRGVGGERRGRERAGGLQRRRAQRRGAGRTDRRGRGHRGRRRGRGVVGRGRRQGQRHHRLPGHVLARRHHRRGRRRRHLGGGPGPDQRHRVHVHRRGDQRAGQPVGRLRPVQRR